MSPLFSLFYLCNYTEEVFWLSSISHIAAHLCGSKKEFVWISSGAYLTVNLKTDESVGERGFKLILEDMTQKPSQKSNIGIQLPINGK